MKVDAPLYSFAEEDVPMMKDSHFSLLTFAVAALFLTVSPRGLYDVGEEPELGGHGPGGASLRKEAASSGGVGLM